MTDQQEARLFSWGARALYLGPALGLSAHRNAVAVLAVGVGGPFGLALDPERPELGYRSCRTAIIPPGQLHHLHSEGLMAFLYLDARSSDLRRLSAQAAVRTPAADFDLAGEDVLIERLAALASGASDWASLRACLEPMLLDRASGADPRVRKAIATLHADPSARPSLGELAAQADLSPSRFIHLFKAATGVPLRRYKLWAAMGAAMRAISSGENLTRAAMDAGFASPSHFSAAFRDMFGMEPSRLARNLS